MNFFHKSLLTAVLLATYATGAQSAQPDIKHVVLISIDGMHEVDMQRFIRQHPHSTLAELSRHGVQYTQAYTPAPADSFPGLMALVTGGTPGQTGIYYDVSYDRALSPAGSDCQTLGAVAHFNEAVDMPGPGGKDPVIDPAKLPRDPRTGCSPVWPHQYLKVNTVFNVVRDAGGYTAWTDKHPVYEIVNGHDGGGVNDLYTPEIGEDAEGNLSQGLDKITASIARTEHYDAGKMAALIHEMSGLNHAGTAPAPVPMLAGLNLQAVNVGEKKAGYLDAAGRPTPKLAGAIDFCDQQIGLLVKTLREHHLQDSTLIILAGKHGNGPIAPGTTRRIDKTRLQQVINAAAPNGIAQLTVDRGALLWLHPHTDLAPIVQALMAHRQALGIQKLWYGTALQQHFGVAANDHRLPDLMIETGAGVIYTKAGDHKLAEHGGWRVNDRHVALLIANPHLRAQGHIETQKVSTTQVAPTILQSLGINPDALQAVAQAHRAVLPASAVQ